MKSEGSYRKHKDLNKKLHCDLESRSRSLVFELDLGLAQIHLWYKFGDSTQSLREVIANTRFVTDGRMDRRTDGDHSYGPLPGRRGTKI